MERHKCRSRYYLLLTDENDEVHPDEEEPILEVEAGDDLVESGDVSILNSLVCHGSPRSLHLLGTINNSEVKVLIDSGSTHNFVQPTLVEKLKLQVQTIKAFKVYIGSGDSLVCSSMCPKIEIELQGTKFAIDLYVLPMRGAEIVFGIQWLRQLGRVTHEYEKQWMEFELEGKTIILKGSEAVSAKRISFHKMQALLSNDDEVYGVYEFHACEVEPDVEPSGDIQWPENVSKKITRVLDEYRELFEVPNGLPPHRLIDHRINLLPQTKPVNVRPYRYPHYQKGEIEKLVAEMLQQGIIRDSHSPYSSPVLLVKKKKMGHIAFVWTIEL